jgi:hypothetical protein
MNKSSARRESGIDCVPLTRSEAQEDTARARDDGLAS